MLSINSENGSKPCTGCLGVGTHSGCLKCGAILFSVPDKIESVNKDTRVRAEVPSWYNTRAWDLKESKRDDDKASTTVVKKLLDDFILGHADGTIPKNSIMFLLPPDSGKRIAMYTLIKNFLKAGVFVPPILDVLTFNIISMRNSRDDQQRMLDILDADIVFVYSTDFQTRKYSATLFLNLCNTRSLNSKPTLFFGGYDHRELSSWGKTPLDLQNNKLKIDHLQYPLIMDGIIQRIDNK